MTEAPSKEYPEPVSVMVPLMSHLPDGRYLTTLKVKVNWSQHRIASAKQHPTFKHTNKHRRQVYL